MAELSYIDENGEILEIADEAARKDISTLQDKQKQHEENKDNPHSVTAEQVGLGNVPNVATNDQTPTYTTASSTTALASGEKLSVAMGKIAKAVSSLISHLSNKSNPHGVTKSQIGLGNVDNTADSNKPVSTAQQTAINEAYANSNYYTDEKIAALINGAPTTLDTLKEIADAMAENEDVVAALEESIGKKANEAEFTSHTGNTSNPHSVTKAQVGLGNVPNVATNDQTPTYTEASTLTALTSGEKLSVAMGNIAKAVSSLISHLANKSNPHGVTKSQIGLGNVDNTADAIKSVLRATCAECDADGNEITNTYVNKHNIIDSLASTATEKPLSANQGKVLSENLDTHIPPCVTLSGENEICNYLYSVSANMPVYTYYRRCLNMTVNHPDLGMGGIFFLEGMKTHDTYEWQKLTKYNATGISIYVRSKIAGTWNNWVAL